MANEPTLDNVERLQRSSRDVTALPAVMSKWLSTAAARWGVTAGNRRERRGLDRHVVGNHHPDRSLAAGRAADRTETRRPGGAHRRGRAGLPHVPARPPIRGDTKGRRTHRRPRPASALDRDHRRRAGHTLLCDGLRRRRGAARRDALHLRRQLVRRRPGRATAPTAGRHRRGAGQAALNSRRGEDVRLSVRRPDR